MATITILNKSHEDWLKNRELGIGSSEVASVLGVSPYETPYQLWLKKTGRVEAKEDNENFLMKAGHYLEDAISHFCADEAGLTIVKSSASEFIVANKDKPYLRVSPDRYAWLPNAKHTNDNKVIIECKSTQKTVDPNDISKYWFVQVMYQLGVTELNQAYLAWLTQGREFDYKVLHYDEDFFGVIKEEVERFWIDCVIGGREPELTTIEDVLIKYPKQSSGKTVYAGEDLISIWSELKDKNEDIKRLKAEKEALENSMKAAMLDAESLAIPADKDTPEKIIATWKASKDSVRFDEDAFRNAEPEIYNKYTKTIAGSRRFSLK